MDKQKEKSNANKRIFMRWLLKKDTIISIVVIAIALSILLSPNHYPQLNSLKDCAFYYDDVRIFEYFHILEYCHHQDESEQQTS